jgi:tetratricopeptide (TPR) repeat protein
MSRIIDVTDDDGTHEILTETSLGGLIGGGKLLGGEPLATYLEGNETASYVLRNKKSGLNIETENETRTFKPNDEYQAVALVTDVRILFVLGNAFEDDKMEIQLGEIVQAKAETSRLRKSKLIIATLSDGIWKFPVRSDPTEVANHVDEMAQIWANAGRLLEDVESQVTAAEDALTEDNYSRARDELAGANENIETARHRIREVGQGATDRIEQRATSLRERVMALQREIYAAEGAIAHADAQTDWREGSYETAAASYETAIEAYEQALEMDGPRPDRKTLVRRAKGAVSERELLRVGPLVDADSARRRAASIEDPEKAAHEWENALDIYREMLSLEWGREKGEFVVEKETIREQTTAVADDAIEDHHEAGRQWLTSGDKLAVQGRREQAREVYERARNQFEKALQLAREVQPEHEDYLDSALETVEERLSGTVPEEVPEEEPLSAAAISGLDGSDTQSSGEPAETEGSTTSTDEGAEAAEAKTDSVQQQSADEQSAAEQSPPEGKQGGTATATESAETAQTGTSSAERQTTEPEDQGDTEDDNSTIIGQIKSQKTDSTSDSGASVSQEPERDTETPNGSRTETPSETTDDGHATENAGNRAEIPQQTPSQPSDDEETQSPEDRSEEQLKEMLRDTDEEAFTDLVADLWEAQGWSTTVFSATAKAVYDIVAMREEPAEERLLVWTVHRPDGGEVGATVVKRCATARESSQGADSATLVTTGSLTSAARTRAEELEVAVVDDDELVHLLQFEELVERLHAAVNA